MDPASSENRGRFIIIHLLSAWMRYAIGVVALGSAASCALPSEPRPVATDFLSTGALRTEGDCPPAMIVQGGWCEDEWSKIYGILTGSDFNTAPAGCYEMQQRLLNMLYDGTLYKYDDQQTDATTNVPVGQWNGGQRLQYIGMHSRLLYKQYWGLETGMTLRHEYAHSHKPTMDESIANTYMGKCTQNSGDGPGAAGPPIY